MSTNTTTDGFRVGRRVRVTNCDNRWDAHEARIVGKGERQDVWYAIPEGADGNRLFYEWEMELLPEPDAPATPEPRFKPKDRVSSISGSYKGWYGTVIASNGKGFHVAFDCGSNAWKPEDELEESVRQTATPEPPADSKPDHYTHLRDAGCEPFNVIRAAHSRDWAIGYHVGTAEAYLLRCQLKHDTPDEDIRKAHAHLTEAVSILDSKPTTSPSN